MDKKTRASLESELGDLRGIRNSLFPLNVYSLDPTVTIYPESHSARPSLHGFVWGQQKDKRDTQGYVHGHSLYVPFDWHFSGILIPERSRIETNRGEVDRVRRHMEKGRSPNELNSLDKKIWKSLMHESDPTYEEKIVEFPERSNVRFWYADAVSAQNPLDDPIDMRVNLDKYERSRVKLNVRIAEIECMLPGPIVRGVEKFAGFFGHPLVDSFKKFLCVM